MSTFAFKDIQAFAAKHFKAAYEVLPSVEERVCAPITEEDYAELYLARSDAARQPLVQRRLLVGTTNPKLPGVAKEITIWIYKTKDGIMKHEIVANGRPTDWEVLRGARLKDPFWCLRSDPHLLGAIATYYLIASDRLRDTQRLSEKFLICFGKACERIQEQKLLSNPKSHGRNERSTHRPLFNATVNTDIYNTRGLRGRTPNQLTKLASQKIEDIAYMAQAYKKLKSDHAALRLDKDEIVKLQKQLEDVRQDNKILGMNNHALRLNVENLSNRMKAGDDAIREVNVLRSDNAKLSNEAYDVKQENANLETQVEDLQKEIKNMRKKFNDWKANVLNAINAEEG
ncbi:hypothetical protein N0V90_003694 [Kalmusia sp. IMI 367209]|nr:hypothetical protein N0V90_003694 [Kalmusia sp. IMI 367209]